MSAAETMEMQKIGAVARSLDIAVETIRMYEREGILLLEKTASGQRVFSAEDIHWLQCIRRLIKDEGLNIAGIRRLLALMPCWKLRPCTLAESEQCPAYRGALRPCWSMKEQIPLSCQSENCRTCNVYQSATRCENLKEVIYQMQRPARNSYQSKTSNRL